MERNGVCVAGFPLALGSLYKGSSCNADDSKDHTILSAIPTS